MCLWCTPKEVIPDYWNYELCSIHFILSHFHAGLIFRIKKLVLQKSMAWLSSLRINQHSPSLKEFWKSGLSPVSKSLILERQRKRVCLENMSGMPESVEWIVVSVAICEAFEYLKKWTNKVRVREICWAFSGRGSELIVITIFTVLYSDFLISLLARARISASHRLALKLLYYLALLSYSQHNHNHRAACSELLFR